MSPPVIPEHDPPQFPPVVVDLFAGVVATIVAVLTVAFASALHQGLGTLVSLILLVSVIYAIGYTFIEKFGGGRP